MARTSAPTIKTSQPIRLNADGTISGAITGTWIHRGNNFIDVTLANLNGGTAVFSGVLSRQWNTNANRFVVTFSVQAPYGGSLWGARTGD